MKALGVRYVYSELQQVRACLDGSNDELIGSAVVGIRLDLEEDKPSTVLMVTMQDALNLYKDLGRVLEEHVNL